PESHRCGDVRRNPAPVGRPVRSGPTRRAGPGGVAGRPLFRAGLVGIGPDCSGSPRRGAARLIHHFSIATYARLAICSSPPFTVEGDSHGTSRSGTHAIERHWFSSGPPAARGPRALAPGFEKRQGPRHAWRSRERDDG